MTIEQLQTQAKAVMKEMRRQLSRTGEASPVFRAYFKNGSGPLNLSFPPGTEELMNSGEAKEFIFDVMRERTKVGDIDAWIMGSDVFQGKATEEGEKHYAEFPQHQDRGFKTLEKMGWVVTEEALIVTAQTETDVHLLRQVYVRRDFNQIGGQIEWIGPPLASNTPQTVFRGRLKMWGATEDDITGFDPSRKGVRFG